MSQLVKLAPPSIWPTVASLMGADVDVETVSATAIHNGYPLRLFQREDDGLFYVDVVLGAMDLAEDGRLTELLAHNYQLHGQGGYYSLILDKDVLFFTARRALQGADAPEELLEWVHSVVSAAAQGLTDPCEHAASCPSGPTLWWEPAQNPQVATPEWDRLRSTFSADELLSLQRTGDCHRAGLQIELAGTVSSDPLALVLRCTCPTLSCTGNLELARALLGTNLPSGYPQEMIFSCRPSDGATAVTSAVAYPGTDGGVSVTDRLNEWIDLFDYLKKLHVDHTQDIGN